jgi:hypothetical protein
MNHKLQFKDIEETTTAMADAAALAARRKAALTGVKKLMKMAETALVAEIEEATCDAGTDIDEAVFITRCVLVEAANRIGAAISGVGDAGRITYERTYCQCDKTSSQSTGVPVATAGPPPQNTIMGPRPLTDSAAPVFVPPPAPTYGGVPREAFAGGVPPPLAPTTSAAPPFVPPRPRSEGPAAARVFAEVMGRVPPSASLDLPMSDRVAGVMQVGNPFTGELIRPGLAAASTKG